MYRPPGMGVDPWYENFKFFLTYWLLSSNNRERMGDGDQLPPLPPNGPQGHPFMSPPPHHKNGHEGQGHQNTNAKSPSSGPSSAGNAQQINWDSLEKNQPAGNSPRHGGQNLTLSNSYNSSLEIKQTLPPHGGSNSMGGPGNHGSHPMNTPGNTVIPEHLIMDKDRRHVCPHCYKGFRSRQQLNQHNLVHSGVRKYHCLYCERAFKQLSHLQQHHRIHTGEKPYRCPLDGCDKAFAQMSNLQHHMRQHDKSTFGQKQCMCPFCDRGYASEKSLKSHLSKMHPDSKLLGLGGQRSNLPLMDGQSHPMLGSPQPGVTISHHNSLPMMHHSMKSPLTPPGGPLELTVNSHQRNAMGADGRKYSLDSGKFTMNNNMPHDSKIFQRSLSERLPDRGHDKIDSMFEQRFGLQNHLRDMNRFNDRSFEPFSPSRFHDAVRSFDIKDLEAKFLDPSGETFQRMAENFQEFRSRFQDQMLQMNRRDGSRQGGMSFDSRNMIPDMNDRGMFFNSRNDMMDFVPRDRYDNSRNYNGMNINAMDSYAPNRHDDLRLRSRNDMGSRNNLSSPNYNRSDRVNENMGMGMNSQMSLEMRRNSLSMDQNINVRNSSASSDIIMNRGNDLNHNPESEMRSSQRNGMLTSQENDMIGMPGRNSIDMNLNGGRMMPGQIPRTDSRNNCSGIMSQDKNMMLGSNGGGDGNQTQKVGMDIVDRPADHVDNDYTGRMHKSDVSKANQNDYEMMDRGNVRMSTDRGIQDEKLSQNEDMVIDDNMNIGTVHRENEEIRMQSRNGMSMGMCNEMELSSPSNGYPEKNDMHQQNMMMNDGNMNANLQDDLSYSRGNSLSQLSGQHSTPKQNGHGNVIQSVQDTDMEFVNRSDDKSSPNSNHISDPNIIRQRKQRKPANPQHVFMPSIDHYTSFAADEVEECGGLM